MNTPSSANQSTVEQKSLNDKPNKKKYLPDFSNQNKSFYVFLVVALIICIFIVYKLILLHRPKKVPTRPIPVTVTKARRSNVPVYISALGSVTSTNTVTVHTQINGTIAKIDFKEGQVVHKGDVLVEIDSRPFEAQLIEFQGELIRDEATLANARIDLKRYETLYPQGAISQQVYETQKSLVRQLEGTVQFDKGQIQTILVDIIYCRIIAPIDGRVGLRLIDLGNLVQTSDTSGIVVLNTINPITVIFPIPEDDLSQVLEQTNAGKTLIAKAYDRSQQQLLDVGTLASIDNQIDPTTGTVKLKGEFPNNQLKLFPNQFVNIGLLVKTLHNAILIPTAAIQHGAPGIFVYKLISPNTVKVQSIKVGPAYNQDTVVTSGIAAGQTVVTEGSDKLFDGAKITVAAPINGTTTTTTITKTKSHSKKNPGAG